MKSDPELPNPAWRFVDLFVVEAREHLRGAGERAQAWANTHDPAAAAAFRRHAHSLKGMAATMGLDTMARLARELEARGLPACEPERVVSALAAIRGEVDAVARRSPPR